DGKVLLWELKKLGAEPTVLTRPKLGMIYSVAFSPDGKWLASGSGEDTLLLWDLHTGSEVRNFPEQKGLVASIAFSTDGKWLDSGSNDKAVRIWNLHEQGKAFKDLTRLGGVVSSVAFSPDGRKLATGISEGPYQWSVALWDVSQLDTTLPHQLHRWPGGGGSI